MSPTVKRYFRFKDLQSTPGFYSSGRGAVKRAAPDRLSGKDCPRGVDRRARRGDEAVLFRGGVDARCGPSRAARAPEHDKREVSAAELVGLDPRALAAQVNQPALVVAADSELEGSDTPDSVARRASSGRIAFKKPARIGNVVHRVRSLVRILVDDPARRPPHHLDHGMIARGVDRDLADTPARAPRHARGPSSALSACGCAAS